MKRTLAFLVSLLLTISVMTTVALGADNSRNYDFQFTADGKTEVNATTGQILTMNLLLKRTDSDAPADMYAMQAEFEYDDSFFQLVDNSVMTASEIEWTDMARRTGGRAFYLNFASMTGGQEWPSELLIGAFQFKVIGETGVSTINAKNCLVSTKDGMDTFESSSNDVRVIVGTDCIVTFVANGGSETPEQHVQYRERIKEPEAPTREGYSFNGWYSDLDRTQLWNFETDTVKGNMKLYAGWLETVPGNEADGDDGKVEDSLPWWVFVLLFLLLALACILWFLVLGKKKVTFATNSDSEMEPIYVKKGSCIERPMAPAKPGAMFAGWYKDPGCQEPWNFETDKVEKSVTLYARWR
jgi:uncharacterized repeat protein (TIGR02543 family)